MDLFRFEEMRRLFEGMKNAFSNKNYEIMFIILGVPLAIKTIMLWKCICTNSVFEDTEEKCDLNLIVRVCCAFMLLIALLVDCNFSYLLVINLSVYWLTHLIYSMGFESRAFAKFGLVLLHLGIAAVCVLVYLFLPKYEILFK